LTNRKSTSKFSIGALHMAGTIGIKLANGDFYPILEENSSTKKRLVLTTVHDGQESVQIDLFRSFSKSMLDAQYIGSVVVEDIQSRSRGEPSVDLVISSGKDGNITADAWDHDADKDSDHNILNVSLKTLDSTEQDENIPDFDLEKPEQDQDQESYTPIGLYDSNESTDKKGKKFPWLIMILATLLVIFIIALLWFFFLGGRDKLPSIIESVSNRITTITERSTSSPPPVARTDSPPPQETLPPPSPPVESPPPPSAPPVEVTPTETAPVEAAPPVETPPPVAATPPAEPPPVEALPPVIQAPTAPPPARPQAVARVRPPAPVTSYKVPAVIPANGAPYQLRWGDTLWDISAAFYRNPWLYPRIARYNNISNPDRIISGRTIRIPPLN
jgi:outer membrane biosynthesis protein TonB